LGFDANSRCSRFQFRFIPFRGDERVWGRLLARQSGGGNPMSRRSAIPSATYRLQLHRGFPFAAAQAQIDYFAALGVSHLYLSPILKARAGSMHGYDVIDPDLINPELGGEPAFRQLAAAAAAAGLGLILDIVPNHMAAWQADNARWLDVLENGSESRFAATFDIDFGAREPGLAGKVLAPILGKPYGEALADGDIALIWDPVLGKLAFAYGPHRAPLRPADYAEVTDDADPAGADLERWNKPHALHNLLQRQNYRLAWWRTAGDAVNWRRFFDINELAGVRIEDAAVFEGAHAVVFRLYAEGLVDGVRVDHIDGLSEPPAYARALRARLEGLNAERPAQAPRDGPWIVVEKILGSDEALPADWGVDGTTGYDFMDEVSALQHAEHGLDGLADLWRERSGRTAVFDRAEISARTETLQVAFAGQLSRLAQGFAALARQDLAHRDLTVEGFRRALVALIARLRVYRSYANGRRDGPPPGPAFDQALAAAAEDPRAQATLDFIRGALVGQGPGDDAVRADLARQLGQLTAPVAAKAVEDTAFYRYGRLLSRNDVGFDPSRFNLPPERFVELGQARARQWPRSMLTTATHDHKRGEDVRARLAVISERAEAWRRAVEDWTELNAPKRPAELADVDDYQLYQTLVGAWPLDLEPDDAAGLAAFRDRISGWRLKSLREAKLRSSWAAPDEAYEAASQAWIAALLDPDASHAFLHSLSLFVGRIAGAGAINGVVQAALRCAWPGVPDLYQGAELWDLSLVDPDNRRPVDFTLRRRLQEREVPLSAGTSGVDEWRSGAVKLAVIADLLRRRRDDPDLFRKGALEPMQVRGGQAQHVLAFARQLGERRVEVAVMLHVAEVVERPGALPAADWWADTEAEFAGGWRPAAELFDSSPVFVGPSLAQRNRRADRPFP
jgi:(1->4)-alpha-D-glucan 1-alpha-D-glucosylmutase